MLSKYGLSDFKEKASALLQGSTSENLERNFTRKQFIRVFFFSVEFSQNRHKEQLKLNSSEQITKDVKQVLQRKGGGTEVAMELLRKTK